MYVAHRRVSGRAPAPRPLIVHHAAVALVRLAVLDAFCERVARFELEGGFTPVPNPVFWALGQRSLPAVLTAASVPAA